MSEFTHVLFSAREMPGLADVDLADGEVVTLRIVATVKALKDHLTARGETVRRFRFLPLDIELADGGP